MNINTIVSCVILPHGITDLTHCSVKKLPSLFIVYSYSFILTYLSSLINKYFHLYIFLLSSFIHFKNDFRFLNFSIRLSYLSSFIIILLPLYVSFHNLVLSKLFMLIYMIFLHVPLHYKKISLKKIDFISIIFLTVIFGLFIPKQLDYIENNNLSSIECISLISLVLGHTLWNIE